jgi:transposase
LQDLSIVGKEVRLQIRVPQFYCEACHRYFSYDLPFADSHKSYTHRQAKWIFELCRQQPFTEVGSLVNMCHKTVENLYFGYAAHQTSLKERYKNVRHLGIDEISHRKGKGDYCCVLTDLERGIQLDILENRKKDTIIAYFEDLGTEICEQIQVVACDIWEPYILAARHCFPNAEVTLDRFHVIKILNESLDVVRKSLKDTYKNKKEYRQLKWLLFKQPKNCSQQQLIILQNAFMESPTLSQVYIQRNRFNDIYETAKNSQEMEERLTIWAEQAQKLEQITIDKFIKTVQNWKKNIAAFANNKVTNAATEGLNNIIRYIKRISFGMPNFQHLKYRILARNIGY